MGRMPDDSVTIEPIVGVLAVTVDPTTAAGLLADLGADESEEDD